ncbi:hypothetical protein K523DRAFT_6148 [Schizophyllum commune Tattone D]|nr:hypothetical protein K523DRAFT_6148 [Schizophyllum commune Tattone D]
MPRPRTTPGEGRLCRYVARYGSDPNLKFSRLTCTSRNPPDWTIPPKFALPAACCVDDELTETQASLPSRLHGRRAGPNTLQVEHLKFKLNENTKIRSLSEYTRLEVGSTSS